jgi:hypothetical protein
MGGVDATRRLRVHQASTRDGPSRFVPQCGRPVSPSGHNRGCVVVDGQLERFTSPSTATNPHPPPQQSPERPNPTPRRKRASAADSTLRVPFLPSAWAKPQPQVSRRTRKRDPPTRTSRAGSNTDPSKPSWWSNGFSLTPVVTSGRSMGGRGRGIPLLLEVSRPARTARQLRPSSEDHPSTEAIQRGPPSTEVSRGHPTIPARTHKGQSPVKNTTTSSQVPLSRTRTQVRPRLLVRRLRVAHRRSPGPFSVPIRAGVPAGASPLPRPVPARPNGPARRRRAPRCGPGGRRAWPVR